MEEGLISARFINRLVIFYRKNKGDIVKSVWRNINSCVSALDLHIYTCRILAISVIVLCNIIISPICGPVFKIAAKIIRKMFGDENMKSCLTAFDKNVETSD